MAMSFPLRLPNAPMALSFRTTTLARMGRSLTAIMSGRRSPCFCLTQANSRPWKTASCTLLSFELRCDREGVAAGHHVALQAAGLTHDLAERLGHVLDEAGGHVIKERVADGDAQRL